MSSEVLEEASGRSSAEPPMKVTSDSFENVIDTPMVSSMEFARRLMRCPQKSPLAPGTTTESVSNVAQGSPSCNAGNDWLDASDVARIDSALAKEPFPDDDGFGTDDAARVLALYCNEHGGDARTMRIIVDSLLCLEPQFKPVELMACLEILVPRLAPVALMPEAGIALVKICGLFEQLLLFHDPEVAFLLRRAQIGAETFCAPWLLTAHAADAPEPYTVLRVWEGWLDSGEALDPVFLGLARLSLCRGELLQCGPVPELVQLLHTSLVDKQRAHVKVVSVALKKANELKNMTPLSFLRRLQDGLLRPPKSDEDAAVRTAASSGGKTAGDGGGGDGGSQSPNALNQSPTGAAALAARGAAVASAAAAAAAAWRQGRRGNAGGIPAAAPGRAPAKTLVCMRVEPQDVMMMETVRERHLKKPSPTDTCPIASSDAGNHDSPAGTVTKDDGNTSGCRLLPKLIDIRHLGEARRHAVKGSVGVDVTNSKSVDDFLAWCRKREKEASAFGLGPMHVLMTSDGALVGDQQHFVKGLLERGTIGVSVLGGGYGSLKPYFLERIPAAGYEEQRVIGERAQEAKEALQKGFGNLNALWRKAPTRQSLLERVAPGLGGPGGNTTIPEPPRALFERAPLPPTLSAGSGSGYPQPVSSASDAAAAGPEESQSTVAATVSAPAEAHAVGDALGEAAPAQTSAGAP